MTAYIAGAITGAPDWLLGWYIDLARELEALGIETYVPTRDEPIKEPAIFRIDLDAIAACDAIVATLSRPSIGTGIEMALHPETPLIGVVHEGSDLSPFVRGFFDSRGAPIFEGADDLYPEQAAAWVFERLKEY